MPSSTFEHLSEKKKIEVKTTLKEDRIHHFLHQQLDTDRLDIRVISILLQKDDAGMSLLDLINNTLNNDLSNIINLDGPTLNRRKDV